MITIIVVEPKNPSNLGAIARAMDNFGQKKLILINPGCEWKEGIAISVAKHAAPILKDARVVGSLTSLKFDYVVATTARPLAKIAHRSPVNFEYVYKKIASSKNSIGILFGREGEGLTNAELALTDISITIPTNQSNSALNLSQAVSIVCYELFLQSSQSTKVLFAKANEKKQLLSMLATLIERQRISEDKKQLERDVFSRMVGKTFLTKREAGVLMGFFRRLMK